MEAYNGITPPKFEQIAPGDHLKVVPVSSQINEFCAETIQTFFMEFDNRFQEVSTWAQHETAYARSVETVNIAKMDFLWKNL